MRTAIEPYKSIIDAANEMDKDYFRRHPTRKNYIRKAIDGEFWPWLTPKGSSTKVYFLSEGVRVRQCICDTPMLPNPDFEGDLHDMDHGVGTFDYDS